MEEERTAQGVLMDIMIAVEQAEDRLEHADPAGARSWLETIDALRLELELLLVP